MTKIKFNGEYEFDVETYNRDIYLNGEVMEATANCNVKVTNISLLTDLIEIPITSIQILVDNESIYLLQNISAHITNIGEYLNTDKISANVTLKFDE